jgi:hypothetical protein
MKNLINHHPMSQKVWQNLVPLAILGLAVHLILPQFTSFENSFWMQVWPVFRSQVICKGIG